MLRIAYAPLIAYLSSEAGYLHQLMKELETVPGRRVSGPRVSIIVPTHNEEKYLPLLLKSLESQTYTNIELIIADWASTDATKEIARRWSRDTGINVMIIDVPRRGIGYACWLAEQEAVGDIIVRTDADTRWPPTLLEHAVNTLLSNPRLALYWTAFTWYDADPITTLFTWIARHLRDPCKPHGRFQAIKAGVRKVRDIFNPQLDVGEDVEVGAWICRELGRDAVMYDRDRAVFASARRLYAAGVIPYLTGEEFRIGFPPRR